MKNRYQLYENRYQLYENYMKIGIDYIKLPSTLIIEKKHNLSHSF